MLATLTEANWVVLSSSYLEESQMSIKKRAFMQLHKDFKLRGMSWFATACQFITKDFHW